MQSHSLPHLSVFITQSLQDVFISSHDNPFPPPPPPPLNITALILPLHVQIFESAMKTLITPINLPDIRPTVQLKTFGQAH